MRATGWRPCAPYHSLKLVNSSRRKLTGPTATSGIGPGHSADRTAEDAGFEPARAVNPTRVPGERHRPLGESSVVMVTADAGGVFSRPPPRRESQVLHSPLDPARRLSCELPQGRKAARVNGLCRVRGVPSMTPASSAFQWE